jgi:thioredoxin 1
MLHTADNLKEFNEILQNNDKVLVDFYAEWCGPCMSMLPTINKIAETNVNVIKINVDSISDIPSKYAIRSLPTLIIFNKGEIKEKLIGAKMETDILTAYNS